MEQWMTYYGIFQILCLIGTYFLITGYRIGGYGELNDKFFVIICSFIPPFSVLIFTGEIKHAIVGAKHFGKKLYNYLPFLPVLLLLLLFFI